MARHGSNDHELRGARARAMELEAQLEQLLDHHCAHAHVSTLETRGAFAGILDAHHRSRH